MQSGRSTEKTGEASSERSYGVPAAAEWGALEAVVATFVEARGLVPPLGLDELERQARLLEEEEGVDATRHEFLLVLLNNALWRETISTIPFARRMLLLPPCLRDANACPAEFDEYGLNCEGCGACPIDALSAEAEAKGYAVLVAEGTGVVARFLAAGKMDAVVGVSCMRSLERTFGHMIEHAVPGMAIPLLFDGCESTQVDLGLVREVIALEAPRSGTSALDLTALRREVAGWFEPELLRADLALGDDPVEELALEWLARDGKRWRPLLTTAVYLAVAGKGDAAVPTMVRQAALAGECIHKGSLIYDDIQDQDDCRYGAATLHVEHGVPVALTVSLFLIGLGYRMLAECGCDGEMRARLLALATQGHCDLCLGQGRELMWMQASKPLTPEEVLEIFRQKTAPSFEVIFKLGAILGDASDEELAVIGRYSQTVGTAYQIKDDLEDYTAGGDVDDVQAGRPSLMMALTHALAEGSDREMVAEAWCGGSAMQADAMRELMRTLGVEERARELLADYRARAVAELQPLTKSGVKILLHRLASKMLA